MLYPLEITNVTASHNNTNAAFPWTVHVKICNVSRSTQTIKVFDNPWKDENKEQGNKRFLPNDRGDGPIPGSAEAKAAHSSTASVPVFTLLPGECKRVKFSHPWKPHASYIDAYSINDDHDSLLLI